MPPGMSMGFWRGHSYRAVAVVPARWPKRVPRGVTRKPTRSDEARTAKGIVKDDLLSVNSQTFLRREATDLERGWESCSQEDGRIQQCLGLHSNVISFFLRFVMSGHKC